MSKCMLFAIAGFCAIAYGQTYNDLYTAAAGYVTLDGNDSGNGANSSFHTAKNWSDGKAPHRGTNYYVKTGCILYLDYTGSEEQQPAGFDGDSIVVGGTVRMEGAYGAKAICGPLTMLPGSVFDWHTVGEISGGSVHVKGTGTSETKPVVFKSGRTDKRYTVNAFMSFSSDEDGELYWRLYENRTIGVTLSVLGDWPDFRGTFRIGRNHTIKPKNGLYKMPGHLIITTNATLQLTAASGQSEIGALTVQANGVLNLSAENSTQTIKIARKLELEPGALVIPQAFKGSHLPAQEFHPVFELTAAAVAAGLPDFSAIPVPVCGRQPSSDANGHEPVLSIFPGLGWAVRDAEGGGKVVGFSYKETVSVTNSMSYNKVGFVKEGTGEMDPAKYWSDGKYPQEGKCYYSDGKNLMIRAAGNPYVFPGDSFMLKNGAFGIYYDNNDITIKDLILCGTTGRFRLMSQGKEYHLRGKITMLAELWRFLNGDKCTQFIHSDISGTGLLRFAMDTEVSSTSWDKTLPFGSFELTGDNSAYRGKMMVDCWQTVEEKYGEFFHNEPYVPGPCSNITLRVSSQANLGGALPEVTYDALTVSNECRLALLSTAVFDDPTRGWFFPENAYLLVMNGAVATVCSPITYGAKLVKEGAGTLVLGGTSRIAPGIEGRPQVKIGEGSLGIASPTAVDGLDVEFAAGTSLCLKAKPDNPEMAERGVDLTGASMSSGSAIAVDLDMANVDMEALERVFVAICTVPSEQAAGYAGKFAFTDTVRKYVLELTWEDNPDSTKTLWAKVGKPSGFAIVVR